MQYPSSLLRLIQLFQQLPGVGRKTAERYAFHMLDWKPNKVHDFASSLEQLKETIRLCTTCGGLTEQTQCSICLNTHRQRHLLCIVASPRDVFSIEETGQFRGVYHVLNGLLSPLHNRGPETLSLPSLRKRLEKKEITEVVLALDSTLEGDATALFLRDELAPFHLSVSRLAFGLPMGSSLDYVDGGTLAQAFSARHQF